MRITLYGIWFAVPGTEGPDELFDVGLGDEAVLVRFIVVEKIEVLDLLFSTPVFDAIEDALIIIPYHTHDADHAPSQAETVSDKCLLQEYLELPTRTNPPTWRPPHDLRELINRRKTRIIDLFEGSKLPHVER